MATYNAHAKQLAELLEQLTVANNSVRQAAEAQYNAMKADEGSDLPLMLLSAVAESSISPHIRKLAAILLRRILIHEENSSYDKLNSDKKCLLKIELMQTLEVESDPYIKSRICDIVGELGAFVVEPGDWPEILPYTHRSMQAEDPLQREMGLCLLGILSEQASQAISGSEGLVEMVGIYDQCLVDSSNGGRVMLSAIRSLAALLPYLPLQTDVDAFQSLVVPAFTGLQMLMGWEDGQALALTFAEALIEIAEECPSFFESQNMATVFDVMCSFLLPEHDVPSPLRHMILEMLVTMTEKSTKVVRKMRDPNSGQKGYFVITLFPICVAMMAEVHEEAGWDVADTPEESVESVTDADVAEAALDRMCRNLGLSATWPVVSAQLSDLLSSPNWQCLHAGLRYLGNYMEVSKSITNKKQLAEHVTDMGSRIMRFISHAHPRVEGAAFYALSHFFLMHGTIITAEQIQMVLPLVLAALPAATTPAPRVRRYILQCISNIVDNCSAVAAIEECTGAILEAVTSALSEGPVIVQELSVTVIVGLAQTSSQDILSPYYDTLMPILRDLLSHAHANGLESLWGQGVECCAMVGEASGKEHFYADALEMMNSLVAMQDELEEGSEARKYLMKAWVRIARCLEEDFLPFLQLVMGQLLNAMSQDVTADNLDPDELETRSDIHMIEVESGWVAVRTAAVEEQGSACQLVVLISEKLQEHFYQYVESCVRAMVPLMESPHEDVRSFTIVAMPEMVRATAKALSPDREALTVLTEYVIGVVIKSVETEGTLELIMTGLQSLRQMFVYMCTNWEALRPFTTAEPPKPQPDTSIPFLSETHMRALTECATVVLRDSLQRRAVLRAEAQVSGNVDEDDAEDEEQFQLESMELHYNIAELLGTIFRTHGALFLGAYQEVWHEATCTMAHKNCLKEDRQFAYFIFSDVIEFGLTADSADSYFSDVMPLLLDGCSMEEPAPRQTCAYAMGMAAEKYPLEFRPFAVSALNALASSIAMGEGEGEPRGQSTDNAVSAVGVILEAVDVSTGDKFDSMREPFPYVWGQWLGYLPLHHDKEEGGRVIRQLTKLLRYKHDSLFCTQERVEQAVLVLVEVLGTDLIGPELTRKVVHTLQLMRVGGLLGDHGLERFADTLSEANAEKLRKYMSMDFSSPLLSSSPHAPAPIHDVLMRAASSSPSS